MRAISAIQNGRKIKKGQSGGNQVGLFYQDVPRIGRYSQTEFGNDEYVCYYSLSITPPTIVSAIAPDGSPL